MDTGRYESGKQRVFPSCSVRHLFDLTAVPYVGAQVAVYRTSRTENLAALPAVPVQSWSFTISAAAYSLTTVVIPLR